LAADARNREVLVVVEDDSSAGSRRAHAQHRGRAFSVFAMTSSANGRRRKLALASIARGRMAAVAAEAPAGLAARRAQVCLVRKPQRAALDTGRKYRADHHHDEQQEGPAHSPLRRRTKSKSQETRS
jgi:hypothetical protein